MDTTTPELSATTQSPARSSSRAGRRIPLFVAVIQAFLFLVHLALYGTWAFFWGPQDSSRTLEMRAALAFLSVSFVAASLLAHRYFNPVVRAVYTVASVWLGMLSFFFLAAGASWIVYGVPLLIGVHLDKRAVAAACFAIGLFAGIAAIVNASWTRVVPVKVKLANLPDAWRGRTAAVISDLHLGHVRNTGFLRRIVRKLSQLRPDVLFIPGDMFDGTEVDSGSLAKIWNGFSAPLGNYFITGNHEQFTNPTQYLDAVRQSGIRVLVNEKVVIDGLQIVGVDYLHSTNAEHFRSILGRMPLDPNTASILLVHNPNHLPVAADAGFSMQLSGHTHRGQYFPFTAVVARMYREFAYGLHRFRDLWVYTSCGVGTWGPPMRLGSNPEIVLLQFE